MPNSAKPTRARSGRSGDDVALHRRIRHITSLQVRNLTPFPARDEFASALGQPSEQSQFTSHGHLSDDLDLSMRRKRGRRRSSASNSNVSLLRTSGSLDPEDTQQVEPLGRKRALSRASIATSSSVGVTSTPKMRTTAGPPPSSTRPPVRSRTLSTASSHSFATSHSLDHTMPQSALSLSGFLHDTSQDGLEHIIQSRLVETFVTITIPPTEVHAATLPLQSPPVTSRIHSATTAREEAKLGRRMTVTSPASSTMPRSLAASRAGTLMSPPGSSRAGPSGHMKSMSVSAVSNGKSAFKPSPPKPLAQRSPIPPSLATPRTPSSGRSASPSTPDPYHEPPVPDYISPIHKPSTNPCYELDTQGGFEFVPDADLKQSQLVVEIWGRVSSDVKGKGKEKEKAYSVAARGVDRDEQDWQVLKSWHVDLNKLVPLTDELAHHPSRLPSNTLCLTLEPFGRTYYLPPSRPPSALFAPSRSPSPSGYNSDPESNVRNAASRAPITLKDRSDTRSDGQDVTPVQDQQGDDEFLPSSRRKRPRTSASWQSMMKLVTLQACILDTEQSVADVAREIEPYLVDRSSIALSREASEREAWVSDLRSEKAAVAQRSEALRHRIHKKQEELRARRQALAAAYELHAEDVHQHSETLVLIRQSTEDLAQLRGRLTPIRNELFTTLAFIYPIDLLSPPDLLFTILDVPLPIPQGPTDPAPPLHFPSRKDINEDSVATALGYAAQVVQFLAAYLGKRLVYPITCIGSRSVIKDGISAMVGPRSFPLFSKGVDTYRFEYGVFLLNKDIEMLMTERNLRALDMRHTLPNLKNMLLTLTDPDMIEPRLHRPISIASTTISALQSPLLTPSVSLTEPDGLESHALDQDTSQEAPRIEIDSPPASGSTTPTKSAPETPTPTSTVRKSRAFLDLAPLSGFFRARYPSSSRSSAKAEPPLEDDHVGEATPTVPSATISFAPSTDDNAGSGDDEDDRRTIRGGAISEDEVPERKLSRTKPQPAKGIANGNGIVGNGQHVQETTAAEKLTDKLRVSPQVVNGVS